MEFYKKKSRHSLFGLKVSLLKDVFVAIWEKVYMIPWSKNGLKQI